MAAVELCETLRGTHHTPAGPDRRALARAVRNEAGGQLDPEVALPLSHLIASGGLDDG